MEYSLLGLRKMPSEYDYCMNLVKQVERKYPVQQWIIDGIQIWPILRVNHSYKEKYAIDDGVKLEKTRRSIWGIVYKKAGSLIRSLKRYCYLRNMESADSAHNDFADGHRDIVFLSYSIYRKAQVNGMYYFTEIFPFLNEFKSYSYLILESAIRDVYKYPRYGKSMLVDKGMFACGIVSTIKKNLLFLADRQLQVSCPQMPEVYEYLSERNVKLLSLDKLVNIVHHINQFKQYYVKILKKTSPKLVIIEWYYGTEGFSLLLAAKQLGIPVADIQHGIQGSNHWAYGDWPSNPSGYQLLPDYFFVWSHTEKNVIQRWNKLCGNKHTPIVTGYQWMSMWRGNNLPFDFKSQIEQIRQCEGKKCNINILFSMDYDFLNDGIIHLIQNSPKDWKWWIRMHPVMRHRWSEYSTQFKQIFAKDNVIWDEASFCALPALLSFVDLHITSGSTIARICQEWGIPTIAENPRVQEGYDLNQCLITIIPFEELTIESIKGVLQQQSSAKRNEEKEQDELKFIKDEILDKM